MLVLRAGSEKWEILRAASERGGTGRVKDRRMQAGSKAALVCYGVKERLP